MILSFPSVPSEMVKGREEAKGGDAGSEGRRTEGKERGGGREPRRKEGNRTRWMKCREEKGGKKA